VSEDDVSSVQRLYGLMESRDPAELRSSLTHDIELSLPEAVPWGGMYHGPDGVDTFVGILQDHVEGPWADPDDFLDAGDRIVVLGRSCGRARSSGQRFEVPFAHVWGLTDGMPSWFRAYFDTSPILAALHGSARSP
jgi:ketosteroid isomerase-like protein